MKTKLLMLSLLLSTNVMAQRIDINNFGRQEAEGLEPGYQAWTFGRVPKAEGRFTTTDGDSITITATTVAGLDGNGIRTNYWKQGVVNLGYKLIADGFYPIDLDDPTGGSNDYSDVTSASGIQLEISGLSAGEHTLLAYHNMVDQYNGNIPTLKVVCDGQTLAENVAQTSRATKISTTGYSYVRFNVAEDEKVTLQYITTPEEGTTYEAYFPCINALVFDEPNPITTASDPYPANNDIHVDCDNSTCQLSWSPSATAVRHHLMMSNDSVNFTELAVTTDTTYLATGLTNLKTYYWRIDEEAADGTTYQGEVWLFRPRHLAFPGAEGYGRYATGGRGGYVYHVTSLADDGSEGTFRYGIENLSGPRTIVFDVGGVIRLRSRLTVHDKFVTIAGQTAPGRGIMLRDKPFGMQSEGITRFLRARIGGADSWDGVSPNENTSDGMGMAGNDHSIMDHCSISWTIDESFSSRNSKNMTLQRTLISEAMNYAGHATQYDRHGYHVQHGYAATIGGMSGSYHHNLLAHCAGRNWSMSGGLDGAGNATGALDMFNNVCYDWYTRTTDGGSHLMQFVNNYYKMGPDTRLTALFSADNELGGHRSQFAHVSGNIRVNKNGSFTEDKLDDTYRATGDYPEETWSDTAFFASYATVDDAKLAYKKVLSDVGCNAPEIDNHDTRMISETLAGTTSTVGYYTKLRGQIDRESDSEGFDGLNIIEASRPADFDTDQDGMPDWWENVTGQTDGNADEDGDGYTNLEEYLNWMALPHYEIATGSQLALNLRQLFRGFNNNPTFVVSSADDNVTATVADSVCTVKPIRGGKSLASITITATDADNYGSMERTVNFYITDDPTGIVSAISDKGVVRREYYNVAGMRMDSPRRGVSIVREISADGSVKSYKVQVK